MKRPPFLPLLTGVLLQVLWLPGVARGEGSPHPSRVEGACGESESWEFSPSVTDVWRERLKGALSSDPGKAARAWADSAYLRGAAKGGELRSVAGYFAARAAFSLRQLPFAVRSFNELVGQYWGPESRDIRLASLACLGAIRQRYPTFGLEPRALESLSTLLLDGLPERERQEVWAAVSHAVRAQITLGTADGEIERWLAPLKGSGPHLAWIRILLAARRQNEAEILRLSPLLAKTESLPEALRSQADVIALTLARAHFNLGHYAKAVTEFKKIPNTSNSFQTAMREVGWAYLHLRKYPDAISTSQNLLIGGLRGTYAPEAGLIVAIALNENCHYPEAVETVKVFGKKYRGIFEILNGWASRPETPYYQVAVNYLKGNANGSGKSGLPDKVGTELLRSPVFVANQSELNALYEARDSAGGIDAALRAYGASSGEMSRAIQQVRVAIRDSLARIPKREEVLVLDVNADMGARVRQMLGSLNYASSTLRAVQAEAYNLFSEKVIEENAPKQRTQQKMPKKDKGTSSAVWDWGNYTADSGDRAETWEDELGFLKSEIKDICTQR